MFICFTGLPEKDISSDAISGNVTAANVSLNPLLSSRTSFYTAVKYYAFVKKSFTHIISNPKNDLVNCQYVVLSFRSHPWLARKLVSRAC